MSLASEAGAGQSESGVGGDYQVVLLIHGIRTQAEWQAMVREKIAVPGKIEVIPIKYGYFDVLRFWFPFWTRSRPIERVCIQIRVALQKYRKIHPDAKLSIIAHSFGTYIIGEILRRGFDLHIHRLILCGSVLPQDFPWEQSQGRFDDDKVINECSKSDIWPVLAQSLSWGYGASGTHGFGKVLVRDRFHAGGHGQYFKPKFVEKYWEPFIRRGEYKGTTYEGKAPLTQWWLSVLGILPFQWIFISTILIIIVVLILLNGSRVQTKPYLRPAQHDSNTTGDSNTGIGRGVGAGGTYGGSPAIPGGASRVLSLWQRQYWCIGWSGKYAICTFRVAYVQ